MANGKQLRDELLSPSGVICRTADEMRALGEGIAETLSRGSMISLEGTLGAGKTQFVKGLARGVGFLEEVSSPSFTLLHEYEGTSITLYHFDFYRLDSAEELANLGYDDCLDDGPTVAEWGTKFPEVLPRGAMCLKIEILEDSSRRVTGHTKS